MRLLIIKPSCLCGHLPSFTIHQTIHNSQHLLIRQNGRKKSALWNDIITDPPPLYSWQWRWNGHKTLRVSQSSYSLTYTQHNKSNSQNTFWKAESAIINEQNSTILHGTRKSTITKFWQNSMTCNPNISASLICLLRNWYQFRYSLICINRLFWYIVCHFLYKINNKPI